MYISEIRYNLKPGTDLNEAIRLFEEISIPVFRKIPGLLYITVLKYTDSWYPKGIEPEWGFVHIQVWENKEAIENARRNNLFEGCFIHEQMEMVAGYSETHADEVRFYKLK